MYGMDQFVAGVGGQNAGGRWGIVGCCRALGGWAEYVFSRGEEDTLKQIVDDVVIAPHRNWILHRRADVRGWSGIIRAPRHAY